MLTRRQFLKLGALSLGAAALAGCKSNPMANLFPNSGEKGIPEKCWLHQNFIEWHYNIVLNEKFTGIHALDVKQRGAGAVYFYCAFHGNRDFFLGCQPVDWYNTHPDCGTVAEFKSLSADLHQHGIAVGTYQTLLYADWKNKVYVEGARDHNSHYGRCFEWKGDQPTEVWDCPAINFASADAVEEMKKVLYFWVHDMGIDGMMYDDCGDFYKCTDATQQDLLFTYPASIKPVLTIDEGGQYSGGKSAIDYGFGAVYLGTPVEDVIEGGSVEHLETALGIRDYAVSKGGAVEQSVSMTRLSEDAQALAFAAYAGTGCLVEYYFDSSSGKWGEFTFDEPEDSWSKASVSKQKKLSKVMKAINSYAGEEPGASRTRLSTGSDPKAYAVKRVSMDGTKKALNIFNFKDSQADITVDLSDSGITVPQAPIDLTTGSAHSTSIQSNRYTVTLPAYGYLLLGCQ